MARYTRSRAEVQAAPILRIGAEWLWVPACYMALAVVFLWPAVWSGAVPLPLMNHYVQPDPVWAGARPAGAEAGANLLLGDISGYYYPYLVFTIDSLRAGQFPLWNPHLFGGMPYFAANQAALLYPINLLCFWLGPQQYWATAALLRLLIAGAGMYLLARRVGVSPQGALLAGGVYMFAAFNVVWLHFAIHNVSALLPLALWLTLRLVARPTSGGILALAGVVAAQMFGGHPETSLFFMILCAGTAALWLHWHAAWRRSAPPIVLALGLGLGLSMVQWLPTLALIQGSTTLDQRQFAVEAQTTPHFAPLGGLRRAQWSNLRHWLLLIAPDLWGSPEGTRIRYWLPERTNYNEMASYTGLVALPLALAGALRGRNRRAARFFGVLLLLALLLLYPLPGLYRAGYLPALDVAYGFRFGLGIALAGAVLAGMGLDWLRTARPSAQGMLMLALAALTALNLAIVYDLWGGTRVRWALGFAPDDAVRTQIASIYASHHWQVLIPAAAGALAAVILAAAAMGRLAARHAAPLVTGIALIELVAHGFGYNGFTQPAAIYPRTPLIARLQADQTPFRIHNLDGTLWANSAMTQELAVTGGLDDLVPAEQQHFLNRGMAGIVRAGGRQVILDWGQRLLDVMNVRYVLSDRIVTRGPDGPALPLELAGQTVRLYRNDTALPRAYAVSAFVLASGRTAEDAVFDPRFDPHRAVVLEQPPAAPLGPPQPLAPVPIVVSTPNRVELAPDLPAPAILVLADAFDADWRVSIDGRPVPLLRANAIFRGVEVPAGRHRVVFSYRPRLVGWGAMGSGCALLGCALLALRRRYDPRSHAK